MDGPLRIGILGTGAIAQIVHLPILGGRDAAEVVAVSDADRAKAEAIAGRFGVPRVLGDEELLADPEIDAVVVCTPSHLHEEEATAALETGKHVLVEKPLALTADGARRVVETAEEAGRTLMVAMNNRYRDDGRRLREFVAGGELGEIFLVRGAWLNRRPPLARRTWRHDPERAGGGALMDLGVQLLDFCLWMLGYPGWARVTAVTHRSELEVEDSAALLVVLGTGCAVGMQVSWTVLAGRDRHFLQLLGTGGTGSLPPLRVYKELGGRPADVTPPRSEGSENLYTASYRAEIDHFLRAAAGEEEAPPPREQVALMGLLEAAYRSAAEGREVTL